MVTHWPGPASPQFGKSPESQRRVEEAGAVQRVGDRARAVVARVVPAAVAAAVAVGLLAMLLPAAMICLTASGAQAGAIAMPSEPTCARSPGASAAGVVSSVSLPAGVLGRGSARRRPAGDLAQRVDVVGVHDAVGRQAARGLEGLDGLDGAVAELAVDRDLVAEAAQEVLEHLDVVAAHALADGDAVAEALGALVGRCRGRTRRRSRPWRPTRRAAGRHCAAGRRSRRPRGWRRAGSAARPS